MKKVIIAPVVMAVAIFIAGSAKAQSASDAAHTEGSAEGRAIPASTGFSPASSWSDSITIGFQAQAGIYGNISEPESGLNFGHLFTDQANEVQLNQVMLTVARPLNPEAGGYDVGFNLQAFYGSDARYDTILGVTGKWIDKRNQIAISQANLLVHTPWLSDGGIDWKVGLMPGAMGVESLDPSLRPFYSLAYVTNYLLPFQNIGVLATWHATPTLDLIGGIDTGNQTSFGDGDNNDRAAGYLGFALNKLADGKLTIIAMSRIGPELPKAAFPKANRLNRYWNDVSLFYKASDKLSLTLEGNYFRDEGLKASAYGVVGWAAYAVSPSVTLNVRGEVYRDETGFVTGAYLENQGFIKSIAGENTPIVTAPPTTYGDLTIGVTIKPAQLQKKLRMTLRPEIRYDRSLNGTRPFNDLQDRDALTIGCDLIVGF
jgi:hypothetical protein